MRLVVAVLIAVFLLSLGALELLAARGVPDADVRGGASTTVRPDETIPDLWWAR